MKSLIKIYFFFFFSQSVIAVEKEIDTSQNSEDVLARRVGEILHGTFGTVVSAMDYPLG